ncbi:MAG: hypothetical protein MAG431_02380 [Chloroflexi bacterium]|nr:hypothetical protein [Chloroflexota bacterium]
MSKIKIFFDSSALFAGIVSPTGAARALLVLAETGRFTLIISKQVVVETERALARKAPASLPDFREALRRANPRITPDPSSEEITAHLHIISHENDVPIVLAAMKAEVDYLVTFNRRHFIDDPSVAAKSGLRIGTPGDALNWLRLLV